MHPTITYGIKNSEQGEMVKLTKDTGTTSDNEDGKSRTRVLLIAFVVIVVLCGLFGLLLSRCTGKPAAASGEPCLVVDVIDTSSSELDTFKKNRPGDYDTLLKEGAAIDPCLLSARPDPTKLDRDDDYDEGFKFPDHVMVVVGAFQHLGDTPNNTAETVAQRAAAMVSGSSAWYAYQVAGDDRFVLWAKNVEQDTPKPKKPNTLKPKPAALNKVNKHAPKTAPKTTSVAPKATTAPAPAPQSNVRPSSAPRPPAVSSVPVQPPRPSQPAASAPKPDTKPSPPKAAEAPKPNSKPASKPSR